MKKTNQNIERISWQEFSDAGMLFFVNNILQSLGLCIVVERNRETKEITDSYPARTKYRGFEYESVVEEQTKIANYLAETAKHFPEEIK